MLRGALMANVFVYGALGKLPARHRTGEVARFNRYRYPHFGMPILFVLTEFVLCVCVCVCSISTQHSFLK